MLYGCAISLSRLFLILNHHVPKAFAAFEDAGLRNIGYALCFSVGFSADYFLIIFLVTTPCGVFTLTRYTPDEMPVAGTCIPHAL